MPYTFDDWEELLSQTIPIAARAEREMQERLRTATSDEARALARTIIRERHEDGGEM